MGIIAVYYKCKKRPAKIYRLARNRDRSMETCGHNAVPVCTGDKGDVYMEEDNSMQHEEDSVFLMGCKAKVGSWSGGQVIIPCAKASASYYNTGIKWHIKAQTMLTFYPLLGCCVMPY